MTEHPTALQVVDGIDLSGKVCVITGASSGLGRESARALAAAGAHVVLAARNAEALSQTARWIAAEVPDAQASTVELDLTALAGVRAAAGAIRDIAPAVDVLMNNAGARPRRFHPSVGGGQPGAGRPGWAVSRRLPGQRRGRALCSRRAAGGPLVGALREALRRGVTRPPRPARAHGSGGAVHSRESRDVNDGARRSRNAATPSRASAVPITRWCSWVSSAATCRGV